MSMHRPDPKQRTPMDRRTFLRRAAAAGIAMPSMAAILAACGKGASTSVGSNSAGGSSTANPFGTGGIAGAPYPLARLDAPVTWNVNPDDVIASDLQPEEDATLKVLRWPYYLDDGVVDAFKKKYNCDVQVTEATDMDKLLAKIALPSADFDILFGVNVWAVGRSIAAGQLRPYNHDYLTNFTSNVWDQLQSPFYDVGSNYSVPYSVWNTGIFWRNDKITIDPASMTNPYDVFWDNPPKGKTHLLGNAQDVLSLAMFRQGLTDVNVTDPAAIDKAKADIQEVAAAAGGIKYDHLEYNAGDVLDGSVWLHQSWSGNASDTVVFLPANSPSDVFSYYWPGTDGHPANVDNDTTVLLAAGKNPVLAHYLADFVFDAKNSLDNFTNTTGYQMPVKSMTRESMVSSGIVPAALETIIVTEEDFGKGSRELELAPDVDALWQQAFLELQSGV
jgi:spermidine/putrescine transport system substrate-binding protein